MGRVHWPGLALWLATFALFYPLAERSLALKPSPYNLVSAPPLIEFNRDFIRVATLGFPRLYEQFLNLWGLQFLAHQAISREDPELVRSVVMRIAEHRPAITSFYMIACYTFLHDFKCPEHCEPLLQKGMEAKPENWSLPMIQGFVYQFSFKNPGKAGLYYQLAASKKDAPAYVGKLANRLLTEASLNPEELRELDEDLSGMPGGDKMREFLRPHLGPEAQFPQPQ